MLDGAREKIEAVGTGLDLGPDQGNVYGKNTGKNFLVRAASGIGFCAGRGGRQQFKRRVFRKRHAAGEAGREYRHSGDTEMMSLNANSRVVVSVPADTKIYIVFNRHTENTAELHKVASASNKTPVFAASPGFGQGIFMAMKNEDSFDCALPS